MFTVLFSPPGPSEMWIIVAVLTVLHAVVSGILALVIAEIISRWKKLQAGFRFIFLPGFVAGEIALIPVLFDYLFIDKLSYIYPIALGSGFLLGSLLMLIVHPKK